MVAWCKAVWPWLSLRSTLAPFSSNNSQGAMEPWERQRKHHQWLLIVNRTLRNKLQWNFKSKQTNFLYKEYILKWCPQNSGHFVLARIYYISQLVNFTDALWQRLHTPFNQQSTKNLKSFGKFYGHKHASNEQFGKNFRILVQPCFTHALYSFNESCLAIFVFIMPVDVAP